MGAIAATVDAIARHLGSACQLVVVCGRNKKLVQSLQSRSALSQILHHSMTVLICCYSLHGPDTCSPDRHINLRPASAL